MNKAKLSKVARTLMFEVNDQVLNDLAIEYDALQIQINKLKQINIEHVQPLIYVDETPLNFLSPDQPKDCLSSKIAFANAPHVENNWMVCPQVVKDA